MNNSNIHRIIGRDENEQEIENIEGYDYQELTHKVYTIPAVNKLPPISSWFISAYVSHGDMIHKKYMDQPYVDPTNWKNDYPEYVWTTPDQTKYKNDINESLHWLRDIDKETMMYYFDASEKLRFYTKLKGKLRSMNAMHVSNAWLKMYEIMGHLPIKKKLTSMHYAEAPGSFLLAINHWLYSNCPSTEWKWDASSYLDDSYNSHSAYLSDKYGLMRKYEDKWFYMADGDGDVTSGSNVMSICQLDNYNLATGDVKYMLPGMNLDEEENINTPVIWGQFLHSIMGLKKGGMLVNKIFSINEPMTICMLYIAAYSFEKAELHKPPASRPANREIYIVCSGYKNNLTMTYRKRMIDHLNFIRYMNTGIDVCPIFRQSEINDINEIFLQELGEISMDISNRILEKFESLKKLTMAIKREGKNKIEHNMEDKNNKLMESWLSIYHVEEIPNENQL
mgnify:CR=1 FL=1